jgi:predicted nucleic acid-binding protein
MMILDTNVLSALMHRKPDKRVIDWLDKQPGTSVWTTSVTILEIRFGLQAMPLGNRRTVLVRAFETVLADKIGGRIAPFDTAAAKQAADLMAVRRQGGRPIELRDTMIAGIALACHATLATRNTSHFDDLFVPVINPWAG